MENRYKINFDLKNNTATDIKFKQGDNNSAVLEVSIFDGGASVDITDETIEFRFKKADGNVVFQDAAHGVSIVSGAAQCVLMGDVLSYPGIVVCEIYRELGDAELIMPAFSFYVAGSIEGAVLSGNYISEIEGKVVEWQADEDARQSAFNLSEAARQSEFDVITAAYDAATHANTVVELTNARHDNINNTDFANVGARMDSHSSQLADKAYKTIYLREYATDIATLGLNTFIQNKLDAGFTKFIIPTGTILTETFKIQRIRNNAGATQAGIIFEGEDGGSDFFASRPHFILNTGSIGVALIETQNVVFQNINMSDAGCLTPSTTGLVLTRDSSFSGVGSSSANKFKNVSIVLQNTPSANGGNGTIGLYNNTGELTSYEGLNIKANIPTVLTRSDLFSLCPTNAYHGSNTDHYFVGTNTFMNYGGVNSVCLLLDGVENVNGTIYTSTATPDVTSCAIKVTGTGIIQGQINIDSEGSPIVVYVKDGFMQGVKLSGVAISVKQFLKTERTVSTTQIDSCEFNVYVAYSSTKAYVLCGANTFVESSVFFLSTDFGYQSIFDIFGTLQGNTISDLSLPIVTKESGGGCTGNTFHTYDGFYDDKFYKMATTVSKGNLLAVDFATVTAHTTKSIIVTITGATLSATQHVLIKGKDQAMLADGLIVLAYITPNQTTKITIKISNITNADIVVGSYDFSYMVLY